MAVKVLFAFYPLYIRYNHGLALLSRLCKDQGIDVDLCLLNDYEAFGKCIQSGRYDHICISCVCRADYEKAIPFAALAKANGHRVLLGGTWAPMMPEGIDSFPPICRGDGETLPDFFLDGNDSLFRKQMFCADLNNLPLPDYDLFKDYPFERGYGVLEGKTQLPYFSSRGCPYRCTFCLTRHQAPIVRIRTKVQEDLDELVGRYHPDIIFMGDALIPYYSKAWRDSWCEFRHPFFAYIHAGIEPEILDWLIDRGLMSCLFGIESGDERFRNDVLKKNLTDDQLFKTVETLRKHNIPYAPFYITGMPGESFALKARTYRMMEDVGGLPVMNQYEPLERSA